MDSNPAIHAAQQLAPKKNHVKFQPDEPPSGSFWLRVGERFGVPTAYGAALLLAGWMTLSWTADNVVLPLMARHMRFLDASEETQRATVKSMEAIADGIEDFKSNQIETRTVLKELLDQNVKTNQMLGGRIKVSNSAEAEPMP